MLDPRRIMKEETILKNEWIKHYNLTAVSTYKYYKIVGCIAIGFEQVRTQGEIQPHIVVYPLWKATIKDCFSDPYVLYWIEDRKGFGYQIPLSEMLQKKDEIFSNAEKYLEFNLKNEINKNSILRFIDKYALENKGIPSSLGHIIELKIYLSTFLNDKDLFDKTVSKMDKMYASINQEVFDYWFGNYQKWKNELALVFSKRQDVLNLVSENIANCRIKHITTILQ